MGQQPGVEFKIGLDTEDIERATTRVVRMRGGPTARHEAAERGRSGALEVKRKVTHEFRDVEGKRATLHVVDRVTAEPWEFEVEVRADFVFKREISQWMLEGEEALDLLVHLCLLESCQVLSYLTSRLGLRPLILPPNRPRE